MKYVEERALNTTPQSFKCWYRCVDENHVCIAREHRTDIYTYLNSINQHIKFTGEGGRDVSIASLDKTARKRDGTRKLESTG